jgi:cephalosporin hydroxylase
MSNITSYRKLFQIIGGIAVISVVLISLALFFRSDQKAIERYHDLLVSDESMMQGSHWQGVPALQFPNDLWIIQEIIYEVQPDVIIETGTYRGASALMWATLLKPLKPQGRILTVDIGNYVHPNAKASPLWQEMVTFYLGSSTDPEIFSAMSQAVEGKKVLVILDSDHSKDHVLKELNLYAPLVSKGSYLIVQDTHFNGHPIPYNMVPGPMEAVEAFLPTTDLFEPDSSRERFKVSQSPHGFLKRLDK